MENLNHTHLQLMGNYAPISMEADAPDLLVTEGKIPAGLNGVLYRNGANPMFPPLSSDHHWFLSEGMIHAVYVKDGQVSYRNRWVRTQQYLAQREAGHRLVTTGLKSPSLPEGENIPKHFAATHVLFHGGKLLALDEWCGPAALDGDTLETVVETWDFEGKHKGALSAHPHIDPDTGEMHGFGYQAGGFGTAEMSYSVVDKNGNLIRHDHFPVPFCSIAHDFAITKEHVIFPLFAADINLQRVANGGPLGAYDPALGTHFGIMRRDGDVSEMRWFRGKATYAFHTINAYTEHKDGRTKVVLDMMQYPHLPLFPDLSKNSEPEWIRDGNGVPVRWTFDMDSNEDGYTEEVLSSVAGEFPVVDERYVGKRYSKCFYAAFLGEWVDGSYYDAIVQLDVVTREHKEYRPGKGHYVLEPAFVPRDKNAPEGDGWVVTIVYDPERNLSDFIVLDTTDISKGPIARVELPTRIPFGFHGSWRSLEA